MVTAVLRAKDKFMMKLPKTSSGSSIWAGGLRENDEQTGESVNERLRAMELTFLIAQKGMKAKVEAGEYLSAPTADLMLIFSGQDSSCFRKIRQESLCWI